METKKQNITWSEMFYSIQGEGPTIGRRSVFLRLTGCNLKCGGKLMMYDQMSDGATWICDSVKVWKKGTKASVQTLIERMAEQGLLQELHNGARLIITGGEPMLQQEAVAELIKQLYDLMDLSVEIETNGTVPLDTRNLLPLVDQFNISLKLSNSGESYGRRIDSETVETYISAFARNKTVVFKFVVTSEADLTEVAVLVEQLKIPKELVWLMPGGETRDEQVRLSAQVVEWCKERGYSFSSRLHLFVWDKATGV